MRVRWTGPRGFEGGPQRDPPLHALEVHSVVPVPTRELNEEVRILVYNRGLLWSGVRAMEGKNQSELTKNPLR